MKNSILTIVFLLATVITFAQETPTTAIQKSKTKSNNTNERINVPKDSTLVVGSKKPERREESTIEQQTSKKKHTKTGHVTLLK